jgi:hypothetical protein
MAVLTRRRGCPRGFKVDADKKGRRPSDDPISSRWPRAGQLEDAGTHITKLPKAEHETAEWLAAMEALILVAERGGPKLLARIGVMRALSCHVERVFESSVKTKHLWGRRKRLPTRPL